MTYEGSLFFDKDKVNTDSPVPALVVGGDNTNQSLVVSQIKMQLKETDTF